MEEYYIKFGGTFQLWSYSVGHQQLLLRRAKSQLYPTRVDILFKGIVAIHLPSAYDGLTILESEMMKPYPAIFPDCSGEGSKLYLVYSEDFSGAVLADAVECHEDDLEYNDPSFFDV